MGMLLVIDIIGVEAYRDVQQCAWGRGYLRAADVSSFCTLDDGVVVQMIYRTNNGRFLIVLTFMASPLLTFPLLAVKDQLVHE
jgi:hypothetical protein